VDRALLLKHLKAAERHVAQGREHIARQRELIAHLEESGHVAKRMLNGGSIPGETALKARARSFNASLIATQ
jgi:hypothetical protein